VGQLEDHEAVGLGKGEPERDVVDPLELRRHLVLDPEPGLGGFRSGLSMTSSKAKRKSSTPKGAPSDHLSPLRSVKVKVVASGETSHFEARFGRIWFQSGDQRTRFS